MTTIRELHVAPHTKQIWIIGLGRILDKGLLIVSPDNRVSRKNARTGG